MQFSICQNTGFHLRLALLGPPGSGKSFTALRIATELGYDKIGIIDTENKSARRYARSFSKRFLSLELERFSPADYIEAIRAAERAGVEVLCIDSLSHAWMGKGGVLEMVDAAARKQARGGTPNSFTGWRDVTPEHHKLVEAMVRCQMHLIVTMRTKMEYVLEKDEKTGKMTPRKVGLQPVQRDGLEYEFDVIGDMSIDHDLCITKSRCTPLSDAVINRPGAEMAQTLRDWLDGVEPGDGAAEQDPRPGRLTPPRRDDHDPERAEQGQEAPGEHIASAEPPITVQLDAIKGWLDEIGAAGKDGTAEDLALIKQRLNETLRKKTKVQGEALRKALAHAEELIKRRAQPVEGETGDEQAAG
jgi:hypothetical protein